MKKNILVIALFASVAVACGQAPKVSFDSLEEAKGTARENSLWNAQKYRQENILFRGWDIISRGDSTQSNECPQGDGWATMDFVDPNKQIVKVKCSTVSANTGCLEDSDFKTKPFSSDDGHCQDVQKVPYPLPKIAK